MVFPAPYLWTSLAPLVAANDGSTEVTMAALAVGSSAFAVEDAALPIVKWRKLPE